MKKEFYPTLYQHLATDYQRNLAVTAGAGTGKTEVLTRRIIKIMAAEKHGLDRLLILTFTDKAAVEMKERIYAAIDKELAKTGQPHFQKLKDTFLNNYISTFHSFCAALLREYPIEARIDPYFRVLDETEKIFFIRKSISRSIKNLAADQQNKDIQILSGEYSRGAINNAVFTIMQKREDVGAWINDYLTLDWQTYRERLTAYRACILRELSYKLYISGKLQALQQQLDWLNGQIPDSGYKIDQKRSLVLRLLPLFLQEIGRSVDDAAPVVDTCLLGELKEELLSNIKRPGRCPQAWPEANFNKLKEIFFSLRYMLEAYPITDFEIGEEHEAFGFKMLQALARVASYCLQGYHDDKGEQNYLDFQDLQLKVMHLLDAGQHPHIPDELRHRFRYLMVDEFQDTNDIQWRIIKKIAADPGGSIVTPKVFVVGDEKQAIYSFRGGDVRLFSRVRQELRDANCEHRLDQCAFDLQLDLEKDYVAEYGEKLKDDRLARAGEIVFADNFRSAAEPVNFFNMFFQDLLAKEVYEEYDARPQVLLCSGNKTEGSVELLLVDSGDTAPDVATAYLPQNEAAQEEKGTSAEKRGTVTLATAATDKGAGGVELKPHFKEALLIADKIKEVFFGDDQKYEGVREAARNGRPAVAILLNRRTMLKTYEEALRMHSISFTVVRGRGFFQRQEVVDMGNLLTFLTDTEHDRALVAFLRSPAGHLSDEAIFMLTQHGEGDTLWHKLQSFVTAANGNSTLKNLSPPDRQALTRAVPSLAGWLSLSRRMPLPEFLRFILDDGGYYVSLCRGNRGDQAISNMEKLLDSARDISLQDGGDLAFFTEWLNNRIDFIEEEGEADMDISLGGAVQIMTVHQAKGLEFPMVFVPDLKAVFNLGERDALFADQLPWQMSIKERQITRKEMAEIGINGPNPEADWESQPLLSRRILKKRQQDKLIAEKKRLFYVAVTRAMDHLVLVGHANFFNERLIQRLKYMPLEQMTNWMDWLNKILGITFQMHPQQRRGVIVYGNDAGKTFKIPYRRFLNEGSVLAPDIQYRTEFPI